MFYEKCIVPTENTGARIKIVSEADAPHPPGIYRRILSHLPMRSPISD